MENMYKAGEIIDNVLPLLKSLDYNDIDYCVYGGAAIYLHYYRFHKKFNKRVDNKFYRETTDIDFIIDLESRDTIVDELYKLYTPYEVPFENQLQFSDGYNTVGVAFNKDESMDISIKMQGLTLDNINRQYIEYNGIYIKVATIDELMYMKGQVISMYNGGREKDRMDYAFLEELRNFYKDYDVEFLYGR